MERSVNNSIWDSLASIDLIISKDYFIEFNTTAAAAVSYSTEPDGTNVISVNVDKKGKNSFKTANYKSSDGEFKYVFDQSDDTARRKREPAGGMTP